MSSESTHTTRWGMFAGLLAIVVLCGTFLGGCWLENYYGLRAIETGTHKYVDSPHDGVPWRAAPIEEAGDQ